MRITRHPVLTRARRILRRPLMMYLKPDTSKYVLAEVVRPRGGGRPEMLSDIACWTPGLEPEPDLVDIRRKHEFKYRQLSMGRRLAQERRRATIREREAVKEQRIDLGKFMQKKLVTQGVHDDPMVKLRLQGRRGFVPTDETSKALYEHTKSVLRSGHKPSAIVQGLKETPDVDKQQHPPHDR